MSVWILPVMRDGWIFFGGIFLYLPYDIYQHYFLKPEVAHCLQISFLLDKWEGFGKNDISNWLWFFLYKSMQNAENAEMFV